MCNVLLINVLWNENKHFIHIRKHMIQHVHTSFWCQSVMIAIKTVVVHYTCSIPQTYKLVQQNMKLEPSLPL